ncbi:cyclopropane-fatty-acyl-phospholipid synthase family protein [SAR86 cluster bacterium]|nr:cyclopropane-fatty-acyl-phospholipid synthase family protein [SAR86 cluster bacterium]MDC3144735.1 cyclopropane-fatty-acyl-phospholipid synthase family protein [SAR86 cluster bacterium]
MLTNFFKKWLEKKIVNLESGSLTITFPNKNILQLGEGSEKADLVITSWKGIWLLFTRGSLGFTEGYIKNYWTTSNLIFLMEFLTKNYSSISTIVDGKVLGRIFTKIQHRLNKNSISGSKKNIEAHYDLGNDFYSMWLDKTMTYSSGFYKDENETIEQAQKGKYQLILDTLDLPVGSRILEIGCGWGGFLEHASNQGYLVKGITISPSQFKFAQDRIEKLEIVPDIELIDYRLLEGKFDAVVSIEMFEAVGSEYWNSYFQKIQNVLKPNAKAIIQTITMTEDYFEGYDKWPDFIQTYIFPGGELASDKLFIDEARKFDLENIKTTNFAKSYAKTLETWYENFQIAWSDIEKMGFDAKFKRTWDMYLAYCRGGFLNGQLEVSQYLLKTK